MRVLVLGVTGMLGSAVFRDLSSSAGLDVYGTSRKEVNHRSLSGCTSKIISNVDVGNFDSVIEAVARTKPNVIINCVGLVKQLADSDSVLMAVPINTLLPHRLAVLCEAVGARLIHVSTDCVFSGRKGGYLETDHPDAQDLYGRSKLMGELSFSHTVTLRTSIIGHELYGNRSLIDWFLAQEGMVDGYNRAVFSGLPTIELSKVIKEHVLPNDRLRGLYHVAASPVDKHTLLRLVAEEYKKEIKINRNEKLVIDRSLDGSRFAKTAGYKAPEWAVLIKRMRDFQEGVMNV